MAPAKVLVTGAFGNVGSHVVEHLRSQGHSVVALDLHNPHNDERSAELAASGPLEVRWTDITDREAVAALLAEVRPDAVVHLAAIIAPVAYRIPEVAYKVNVVGTRNLIDAAAALNPAPRFVFTSSYSVHGPRNPYRSLPPITSGTPVDPRDNYGCHKVLGERMVRASGLEWVVVRLPAVWPTDPAFGRAPEFLEFSYLLPADRNEHAIDSRDAALALANAATRDVAGRTFVVGGGPGWSGKASDLFARLYEARGLPPIPSEAYRTADPETDDSWYYEDLVDTTESQEALDYQKHTPEQYFAAVRPGLPMRLVLKLARGAVRRKLLDASPYHGAPQAPDSEEIWVRICERFGTDPSSRDCM